MTSFLLLAADYAFVVMLVVLGATMASTGGNGIISSNHGIALDAKSNRLGPRVSSTDAHRLFRLLKQQEQQEEEQQQNHYLLSSSTMPASANPMFCASAALSSRRRGRPPVPRRARLKTWG
ncbi:hypothetical protein ACA910_022030 [Epithemia clementina (nom. ined.)]